MCLSQEPKNLCAILQNRNYIESHFFLQKVKVLGKSLFHPE